MSGLVSFLSGNTSSAVTVPVSPSNPLPITYPGANLVARNTEVFTGGLQHGAVGSGVIFAITGSVKIVSLVPICTASLVSAGGGSISLGVNGSNTLFIAATTATAITTTNPIWMTTTPAAAGLAQPAALQNIVLTAATITFTVTVANVTAGSILFRVDYIPISTDGLLVGA